MKFCNFDFDQFYKINAIIRQKTIPYTSCTVRLLRGAQNYSRHGKVYDG